MLDDSSWGFVGGDMLVLWAFLFRVGNGMAVLEIFSNEGFDRVLLISPFSCIRHGPSGAGFV